MEPLLSIKNLDTIFNSIKDYGVYIFYCYRIQFQKIAILKLVLILHQFWQCQNSASPLKTPNPKFMNTEFLEGNHG